MFTFGKRFYAPVYFIALMLLGMLFISIIEILGLSKREDNLYNRGVNVLGNKNILIYPDSTYSYSENSTIIDDYNRIYSTELEDFHNKNSKNKVENELTIRQIQEKIEIIDNILLNSVSL